MNEFGKLELTSKGTNNGSGYDIYYEFSKGFNFVEIESKRKFYFIQPWIQFPNKEYLDECEVVSIELVKRFNNYEKLQEQNKILREALESISKNSCCEPCQEAKLVAREALAKVKE